MRDDIEYKIRDTLPSGQLNALQTSMGNFVEKLKAQKQFSPPGELLSKIKVPTDGKSSF